MKLRRKNALGRPHFRGGSGVVRLGALYNILERVCGVENCAFPGIIIHLSPFLAGFSNPILHISHCVGRRLLAFKQER
ncbi:hypothetical protein I7I53_07027 [Histoplasma capsulatum var. duboisii H88]|uniref:Uncharacterized protein n=1 Tax=Ajellomyces capsulatus (strain H88) TaxID=544711 RepID=A0A8A1LFI3_AJEC8|nr:hypothetical protein I7I53_07027 [Histoplasma capsulatum var. duboisii H88]